MQESIGKQIVNNVKKCGSGSLFFPNSFVSYGDIKSVSKSLERLTNDAVIIRLANGIYLYPTIDKELGLGVLYPSVEEVASQVAKRDKAQRQGAYCTDWFLCHEPSRAIYPGAYECGLPDRRLTKKD